MTAARVFVYEFVTGGGLAGEVLPSSLRVEGLAMLSAIVADLAAIDGVHVTASLDARLAGTRLPVDCVVAVEPGQATGLLEREASRADAVLIIAPEFDGVLLDLARAVERMPAQSLGPSPDAIALAADKLVTAQRLAAAGVPVIPTRQLGDDRPVPAYPFVVKPRNGAGSQDVVRVDDAAALDRVCRTDSADLLVQPYVAGTPASAALLVGPAQTVRLLPARQHLSDDGRFAYRGGSLPLPPTLARRASALAARAVAAIDGLHGYVGVDLILGPSDDDSGDVGDVGDVVVEINPRLTTSYVGLRAMTDDNLAYAWLRICAGEPVAALRWRDCATSFTCDGKVRPT